MPKKNQAKQSEKKTGVAFVAGATGYTGQAVVRSLVEWGIPTVAHVRPDSPRLGEWQKKFIEMGAQTDCTRWDLKAMTETMQQLQPAYVFSLLGTTRKRIKQASRTGQDPRANNYEAVDYLLTAQLIQAAVKSGAGPRLIYLSASGVKPNSASAYYRARVKAEMEVRVSGLPYIIARPSIISGSGREESRPLERVSAVMLDGFLAVLGLLGAKKLKARYSSNTSTVLGQALVRLARDPDGANKVFESEDLRD